MPSEVVRAGSDPCKMGAMKFHLFTLLLVAGAVVCYFVGVGEGIVPLIVAYLAIEFTIGIRLHRRRRRNRQLQGSL